MKPLPTDLQILNAIYDRYYDEFKDYSEEKPSRLAKMYVAIDILQIAEALHVDPDIVFGRLYYHLNQKYEYTRDGRTVPFFTRDFEEGKNHVNFPYVASVLAELRADEARHRRSVWLSIVAILISLAALIVSFLKH